MRIRKAHWRSVRIMLGMRRKSIVGNLRDYNRQSALCSPYTISIPMQVRAVMTRKVQILMGNKLATILKLMFVFLSTCITRLLTCC